MRGSEERVGIRLQRPSSRVQDDGRGGPLKARSFVHVRGDVRFLVGAIRPGYGQSAPRIVLYSRDTLGFGHLRRNLLIAGTLRRCRPAPEILMIAGMCEAGAFELPVGVDCLSLPAYEKRADGAYWPRDLGHDLSAFVAVTARGVRDWSWACAT